MKNWKALVISLIVAVGLQVGIFPWAWIQGTLEIWPLYLIFTLPVAGVAIIVGLIVSLVKRPKAAPAAGPGEE